MFVSAASPVRAAVTVALALSLPLRAAAQRRVPPEVRRLRGAIVACQRVEERAGRLDEAVRLDVSLTVERDGAVSRADASGGGSATLRSCVERAFRAHRFPSGSERTRTRVPIVLDPSAD